MQLKDRVKKLCHTVGLSPSNYAEPVKAYSEKEIDDLDRRDPRSFPSLLPYSEYMTESETFLLEDNYSQAIIFTINPIPTEGRSQSNLIITRDKLQGIFENEVKPKQKNPWIIQEFAYQDDNISDILDDMKANMSPEAKSTKYSIEYLVLMKTHLKGIAKEQGIFKDELTQKQWKGEKRRCKFILFRRCSEAEKNDEYFDPIEDICAVREGVERQMRANRIQFSRDTGIDFFRWMLIWFNPNFALASSKEELFKKIGINNDDDIPYGFDFSEALIHSKPRIDIDNNCWWFDGKPHTLIRSAKFNKRPEIGQLSGEISNGIGVNSTTSSFMDGLPPGTIITKTMLMTSQDDVLQQAEVLENKCRGGSQQSNLTINAIKTLKQSLSQNQNICRLAVGVYIRGSDLPDLKKKARDITALLFSNNITSYRLEDDGLALKSYIDLLPMNFFPNRDPKNRVARKCYVQHAMNLSLLWGREEGSEHVSQIEFNRGGSPITYDQFDRDKVNNAFGLIVGPPGSGKSAKLVDFILTVMANYRPKVFIIEKGNSFGLMGKYLQSMGVSVNSVNVTPGSGTSLPPFADSHLLFEQENRAGMKYDSITDDIYADLIEENPEDDEQRDIMGEMEVSAMLMITGGEKEEQKHYRRAERGLLRRCIRDAAITAKQENRMMLTQDLQKQLAITSKDPDLNTKQQEKLADMAAAMDSWTHGFDGELFNREGEAWPDVDVTIVDLGTLTKSGYEAQLALTYISLMMKINAIAEANQFSGRHNLVITDESHIITTEELLLSILIKIVKMFRKLNTWPIFATQNLSDFPDVARKLLNMIEWWQVLAPSKDEIEQLKAFKDLSEEQITLMKSCRKQTKCYTEGVLFSEKLNPLLFRSVPPSLHLVLAGSDGKEKKALRDEMHALNCSDIDAAISLAKKLDKKRGII
ncbi:conjugative transfer ATPase [uncultured Shewanella sp.]|uniref:conjugative transfer ATPase n=1 Tax=uncultured Shewanella sp. TaxID=173975 RepID=UPI002602022D|nr:conjugative transfer ATPase [uncultured Shewanella sp.]